MAADGIVEAVDVTADCDRSFDPALEEGAPDEFGLEGLEERLDHGVVEAVSLARARQNTRARALGAVRSCVAFKKELVRTFEVREVDLAE